MRGERNEEIILGEQCDRFIVFYIEFHYTTMVFILLGFRSSRYRKYRLFSKSSVQMTCTFNSLMLKH